MENRNKTASLPDSFATEEEAGEFWDAHSTMDYEEYLEPVDAVIEIRKRVFTVRIAEDIVHQLTQEARSQHRSVPQMVDQILRKMLASGA